MAHPGRKVGLPPLLAMTPANTPGFHVLALVHELVRAVHGSPRGFDEQLPFLDTLGVGAQLHLQVLARDAIGQFIHPGTPTVVGMVITHFSALNALFADGRHSHFSGEGIESYATHRKPKHDSQVAKPITPILRLMA